MKKSRPTTPPERRDRLIRPKEHDTYRARSKHKDTVVCDDCGLTWHDGRWTWDGPPVGELHAGICPACQRIRDRYPAGTIEIHGGQGPLREEILGLIRNVEEREKGEHPLERLMDMQAEADVVVVTTTGLHLARCIADALKRRFKNDVTVRYVEEQQLVHVELSTRPA